VTENIGTAILMEVTPASVTKKTTEGQQGSIATRWLRRTGKQSKAGQSPEAWAGFPGWWWARSPSRIDRAPPVATKVVAGDESRSARV